MAIFVGQGTTKSCYIKIFESQYLSELWEDFLHAIIHFIDFKINFSNIGSYGAHSFISEVVSKLPPPAFGSFRPEWYCTLHCDGFFSKFQNFKTFKIACLELILMTN